MKKWKKSKQKAILDRVCLLLILALIFVGVISGREVAVEASLSTHAYFKAQII